MPRADRTGRPRLRIVHPSGGGSNVEEPPTSDALLRRAAARAATDTFYVASALKEYREAMDLDETALADELGCTGTGLTRLALCRTPDTASSRFRQDVERIAAYAGARPPALLRVLRFVDSARAMREAAPDADALLAARNRTPEPDGAAPKGEPT